jgi:Mg/Co/Ni transporter MgtE
MATADENKADFGLRYGSPKMHEKMTNHPEPHVRESLAMLTDSKPVLSKLSNDKSVGVRREVAKRGHDDHLKKLMHDSDYSVRGAVAYKGKHLDHLINDEDEYVRTAVASRGTKAHHDVLVNDVHPKVRAEVAEMGTDAHRDKLVNDPEPLVRARVAKFGNDGHRDKLVHDVSRKVRTEVATKGNDSHHQILKHDKDTEVQRAVMTYSKNPDVIHHLATSPDSNVKGNAGSKYRALTGTFGSGKEV